MEDDACLDLIGGTLISRVRQGELKVFDSVEDQNALLDSLDKHKQNASLNPLRVIFAESKGVRARAHKLERFVSERLQGVVVAVPKRKENREEEESRERAVQPVVGRPQESRKGDPELTPRDSVEFVEVGEEPYALAEQFARMNAQVRVRSAPDTESTTVLGMVNGKTILYVVGVADAWLKVRWENGEDGFVTRNTPQGFPLFVRHVAVSPEPVFQQPQAQSVSESYARRAAVDYRPVESSESHVANNVHHGVRQVVEIDREAFEALVQRVIRLECELSSLKSILKSW